MDSEPIGGLDKIVEIDESKFGKRKYNKGRKVDGVWVFSNTKGVCVVLCVSSASLSKPLVSMLALGPGYVASVTRDHTHNFNFSQNSVPAKCR